MFDKGSLKENIFHNNRKICTLKGFDSASTVFYDIDIILYNFYEKIYNKQNERETINNIIGLSNHLYNQSSLSFGKNGPSGPRGVQIINADKIDKPNFIHYTEVFNFNNKYVFELIIEDADIFLKDNIRLKAYGRQHISNYITEKETVAEYEIVETIGIVQNETYYRLKIFMNI